jgi:hypothetical protein
MKASSQHTPAALTLEKKLHTHVLCEPQSLYERFGRRKNLLLGFEFHAIQPVARHCTNYATKCKKYVVPHQYGSRHTTCTEHILYPSHHKARVTEPLSHTKPATFWSLVVCISLLFSLPYIKEVSQSADLRVISSSHPLLLKIYPHNVGHSY